MEAMLVLATLPNDHESGIAPNSWLIDQAMVDEILETGTTTRSDEVWAQAVPEKFSIITSKDYTALRKKLQERIKRG